MVKNLLALMNNNIETLKAST